MASPSTLSARAARWQQLLAIIVVLSSMLTASSPASSEDPPPSCVDVYQILSEMHENDITNDSYERIIRLKPGKSRLTETNRALTLCGPPEEADPVYGVRFEVEASNVLLDCGGVVFDGGPFDGSNIEAPAVPATNGPTVDWAISFDKDVSPSIHDVVIRNCNFQNFPKGIIVSGTEMDEQGPDLGFKNITLQDITLENIDGGAIKIGAHNRDNLLERITVIRARLYAVYLEAYSSHTRIHNSHFADNGWPSPPEPGSGDPDTRFDEAYDGREAIAIDGSSHNEITDNVFINNRYAGIALYKTAVKGTRCPPARSEPTTTSSRATSFTNTTTRTEVLRLSLHLVRG